MTLLLWILSGSKKPPKVALTQAEVGDGAGNGGRDGASLPGPAPAIGAATNGSPQCCRNDEKASRWDGGPGQVTEERRPTTSCRVGGQEERQREEDQQCLE